MENAPGDCAGSICNYINEILIIIMAKKLVIAFDVIDEENRSLIGDLFNSNTVPLIANEINSLDVSNILMAIYRFSLDLQGYPSTRHLFPQTPYGISMEPGSKVTDKSDRIYSEALHGHTTLVHLPKDDSRSGL
jgi:hypothetical protein